RWLAGVHPRFLTPVPSLALHVVISIALTLISTEPSWKDSYNRLFTYVVLAEFIFYAMSCGAVLRLRRTAPDLARPYRTWGYPVTPIVFILFSVWLVFNTARAQPADTAMSALLIVAGLPLYFLRRSSPRRSLLLPSPLLELAESFLCLLPLVRLPDLAVAAAPA